MAVILRAGHYSSVSERDGLKMDAKASATILRQGPVSLAGDTVLDNTYLSTGQENPLTLRRAYKGGLGGWKSVSSVFAVDFICHFELSWYPFDTQLCYMNVSLEGNLDIFVNLSTLTLLDLS